jgi:hypothetical protein
MTGGASLDAFTFVFADLESSIAERVRDVGARA